MTLKIEELKNIFIASILVIFATSSKLIDVMIPSKIFKVLLISILLCIALIYFFSQRTIDKNQFINIIIGFLMILLTFYKNEWWGIAEQILFSTLIILCLCGNLNPKWAKAYLNISFWVLAIYAFFTIFCYFNEGFYMGTVTSLYPHDSERMAFYYRNGWMTGLTYHYSTNGLFMVQGLIISVARMFQNNKNTIKNFFFPVLFFIALLLTAKRGPVIFVIFSIFIVYYISLKNRSLLTRVTKFICLFICFVTGLYFLLLFVPELSMFVERFVTNIQNGDLTSNRATLLWPIAIQGFLSNPIIGCGWLQYTSTLSRVIGGEDTNYHAHNIYLQLLCETGVVGFLIYSLWFFKNFLYLYRIFVQMIKGKITLNKNEIWLIYFSMIYQIYFLISGVTGNSLYDKEMYIMYFVSCVIGISTYKRYKKKII